MAKAVKSAIKVFVVTYLVATGLAFVLGTAGMTGAFLFGVETSLLAGMSAVSTLLGGLMSKGISATSENFGNKVATRTATAPRQIIYGKARVGGTITHIETSGTDNYKLSMIVVLAGHEVESLEDVLINDEILTTTTSGGFEYATNSKFVNADNENKFGVQSSLLRYVFVDGSQTTANSTVVNNTSLTSSDKFIGMSYMLIEMVVDSEAFGGGIPPMAFVVKGKKVYDPRTSSTAWSDNPALCVRDYITDTTYGLKATSSEVLDTTALGGFSSAANTCDSGNTIGTATVNGAISSSTTLTVDISSTLTLIDVGQTVTGTGISGTVKVVRRRGLLVTLSSAQTIADGVTLTFTEELYTANGITNMSASGSGVIEGLLSACAGKISYIDGKFVMFAGASVTPDMTITDDNLLAPISIATKQTSGESFNTVKAVYVDANNNYVATDSPTETPINPDSSVTFLSEDTPTGESQPNYRKTLEIQLPFTDTTTMAQRLQRTALLHTRKEVSLSVLCNIAYMQLQPFDWVYLTNERLGFTNKTFEVLSTNLEVIESDDVPVLATRLALKEIDSSVYAFASSSYTSPIDEGTSVSTGSFSVTAPTGLSVSATLINTGYDLQVQWTNNPDDLIQGTEILYGTSSGTYIGSLITGKGKTKEIIPNVKANSVYYIVARHFSANNVFSANTSEININTNSDAGIVTPSAPTSLSATTGKPLSIGLSWSNPSSTDLRDIQIYRSTSSGFTPNDGTNLVRTIAGVPSVTQKVSFGVDDGLVSGTNYYFKVKAVSFFDKVSSASSEATGSFTKVDSGDIDLPDFSGYFHKEGNTTTALTSSQFNTEYGRTPLNDDILIMVNTSASPKVSKAYKWNGSTFVEITNFTTGDLVVDGTLGAAKIVAGSLSSDSGVFGSISAGDIDTGTLNAANVTISGGDVTINNSGIAINGSSSSINLGSGAFVVTSGGALTATSATITGEVNATSGTFNGSIAIGSGNNIFKADTNGIYLGNTSYASALFKVSPAGVVQSDKRITSGTGTTQATLSGEDTTYRFWSGGTSGSTADFSVSKTGEIIAKKISIYNNEGGLIFSSDAGFSDLALTQISAVTGTPVQSVSDTFSANGDTSASWQSITLVANTNLSVSVSLNTLFGGDGFSNTSSALATADALAEIPDNFTLQMQYSSDGGSNWNNIAITTGGTGNSQQFTKTTSISPTAQQYSVEITNEAEPAFFVAFADVRKGNTLSNYGSVDANGFTNITGTITNLAGAVSGTTYKFRTLVTTTDSGYNTVNKVTATAPRTLTITDTSGDGFYIDNGDGSQTVPTGDITSVTAGDNLNGGGTSGAVTLNLDSTISGDHTFSNNVVIGGNLDVQGTTTTIDTTNLDVKDKNITLNYGTGDTSANANGAGITIQDAVSAGNDASLTWTTANDTFNLSHPLSITGALTLNNTSISGVNQLAFNDPGPNEGISFTGGNIKIYESPNDLTTNSAGNLQVVYGSTRRLTVNNSGIDVNGNVTATAYYGDGSNLTGITGTATTINNNADNRIITGSGTANTLNAESGLTYNGSALAVTGNITATTCAELELSDSFAIQSTDGSYWQRIKTVDSSSSTADTFSFDARLGSGDWTQLLKVRQDGLVDALSGYRVNGTTRINNVGDIIGTSYYIGSTNIIDTSANLTNIGTISSGAITAPSLNNTGTITINSTGVNPTVTLNRYSGQPNLKAGTDDGGYLIMDSSGGYLGLNWYSSDNIVIGLGGGNTGIGIIPSGYKLHVNGTIGSGAITSSGTLIVGAGTQSVEGDADITVREGNAFAGIDLKSLRTSGNIGGVRSYNSSNTLMNNLLFEVQGRVNLNNNLGIAINGTTFVDGARNLTNIGTISSGAITVDKANGTGAVVGMQLLSGSSQGDSIAINFGSTTANEYSLLYDHYQNRLNLTDGGSNVFYVAGGVVNFSSAPVFGGGLTVPSLSVTGNGTIQTGAAGLIKGGYYQVGSTTVIDTSRNLTNIGTISSGAITSSGKVIATQLDLVGTDVYIAYGTAGTAPGNGDYLRLRDVATGNDALQFYQDSVKLFSIDGQTGNAYHKGTISSGAITSTGTSQFDRVKTGLGTVGSPAVQVGDNDSGFFDSGANEIGVSLAGVLEYEFIATQFDMKSNNLTGVGTISSGAITTTGNVTLGTFSTTNSGTLILTGTTANKAAELKCTNGNLHIDSEAGNATYINYFEGTGGVFFGTGASGHQAHINSAGGINLRGSGAAPTNSAIAVNGTSILDNSRNLTNIGTISQVGAVSLNSNSLSDPDSTSRTRYPAGQMLTHYSEANGVSIIGGQGGYTGCGLTIGEETDHSANFKFIRGVSDTNGTPSERFSINGVGDINTMGTLSAGFTHLYKTGSGQTIVAVIGSDSKRPVLQFSESTATTITAGMSLEYNGVGAGATNYMSINAVTGASMFQFSSGGDFRIGSTTVIDSSRNLTNIGTISSGGITSTDGFMTFETSDTSGYARFTAENGSAQLGLFRSGTSAGGMYIGADAGGLELRNSSFAVRASLSPTGVFNVVNSYQLNGTTVIDASRNLKNITSLAIGTASVTSGYQLEISNIDEAAILIRGDTDNAGEDGNALIKFSQDGALVESTIGLTAGNDYAFNNLYGTSPWLFQSIGVTKVTISSAGAITAANNITAYSDKRLKTNIQTLDSKKALQMRGVSFIKDGVEGSGVIAQEIEEIAPELVLTADDEMGTKSVAYGNLVGYLIETVKDQQKQIDELKQRLDNDSSN